VVVGSKVRPRYVDAAPTPGSPAGNDQFFRSAGHNRWALGVTISDALAQRFKQWALGVQLGTTVHDVDVQTS